MSSLSLQENVTLPMQQQVTLLSLATDPPGGLLMSGNTWLVQACDRTCCQPLAFFRLFLHRVVFRIRQLLHHVLLAKRRWCPALDRTKFLDAFLHVFGVWLPPTSSISELHLVAGGTCLFSDCSLFQSFPALPYGRCFPEYCSKSSSFAENLLQ